MAAMPVTVASLPCVGYLNDSSVPEGDIITGRRLMDLGLPVVLNDRPSAVVITYEKVGE
jgi:hypothetical protein